MNKIAGFLLLVAGVSVLSGCGRQNSPSMMNTERPQLSSETRLEQVPVTKVGDGYISKLAESYDRYGADTMQISLVYDPKSKSYTAMKAYNDLADIKSRLKKFGVTNVAGDIVKQEGAEPTLMVAYDAVTARPPAGCRTMPGFDDGITDAHWNEYKFGCSVDTMLARQIYRPSDLAGKDGHDPIDGRKAANSVEYDRQVAPEEAEGEIIRIQRSDIQQ